MSANTMQYPRHVRGLTLVELMIALVLGLLVTGAAVGMFISNKQAYTATESVGRIQENSRMAFELMARDIREAAGNPCSANLPVVNVVTPAGAWQYSWNSGITGYENGALGASAAGTDAIEVKSGGSSGLNVTSHDVVGSRYVVAAGGTALKAGDIALVCDYREAAIFVVASTSGTAINYNLAPRADGVANCALGFGFPNPCTVARPYTFQPSTIITKLRAARWYVAPNRCGATAVPGVNFNSLCQAVDNLPPQEIVEGVSDMEIQYLVNGSASYQNASAATNWPQVTAVRITLNMQGGEGQGRVGTDNAALRRTLYHVVTLRNHNS
jgi:type IV pilus assembly protein PilW